MVLWLGWEERLGEGRGWVACFDWGVVFDSGDGIAGIDGSLEGRLVHHCHHVIHWRAGEASGGSGQGILRVVGGGGEDV